VFSRLIGQVYSGNTREEFLQEIKKGTYDDVVVIYRANDTTGVSDWRSLGKF
jgi:hypothetical protein